jgi:hypothetical protein
VNDIAANFSLVTIGAYRDLPDALLAKSILDSAEIPCVLADDNIVRLDWFYSYAVGGVKLRVTNSDADDALQLLHHAPLESFIVEGVGDYRQPRCPNCASFDLRHDEFTRAAYAMLFYFPLLVWLRLFSRLQVHGWRCHSCGLFAEGLTPD